MNIQRAWLKVVFKSTKVQPFRIAPTNLPDYFKDFFVFIKILQRNRPVLEFLLCSLSALYDLQVRSKKITKYFICYKVYVCIIFQCDCIFIH